eukprot:COSAG01_NODE_10372_length_2182_cov_3.715314_2_plen_138_part_01
MRHRDASPLLPDRLATAILYLNDGWAPADGGELRLYHNSGGGGGGGGGGGQGGAGGAGAPPMVSTTLPPTSGRLVVFDAQTEHEVLPSQAQERWAITAFLYRAKGGGGGGGGSRHGGPKASSQQRRQAAAAANEAVAQ